MLDKWTLERQDMRQTGVNAGYCMVWSVSVQEGAERRWARARRLPVLNLLESALVAHDVVVDVLEALV